MIKLNSKEIRERFLKFFKHRGHTLLSSASLVPENDPSVLFTTAGMQPLVPYLMGEKHPAGRRLANSQKCVRLTDIDEVGDQNHSTFFEMLGNWSLGDYFKNDSVEWSFLFLTSAEEGLGLDPKKIYVSIFAGDKDSPRDEESIFLWKKAFAKAGLDARVYGEETLEPADDNLKPSFRIFPLDKAENWWPTGGKHPGPQGPDTEIFFYWGNQEPNLAKERIGFNDKNFWEIWNNVFMEYSLQNGKYISLSQKNVDTGMGLERICAVFNGQKDIFLTDLYQPIIRIIEMESQLSYGQDEKITRSMRIIADHLRAVVFLLGDDSRLQPSNLGHGYVLRKLIRRVIRYQKVLNIPLENKNFFEQIARVIVENYAETYPELGRNFNYILEELKKEEERFHQTLDKGLREWEKISKKGSLTGEEAFLLFATYGFPLELTRELAAEKQIVIDEKSFREAFKKHQQVSRQGAEKRFRGGLIDDSYENVKLHTATHLLQSALRQVLGDKVEQKGSNITPERLRFDFSYPQKLSLEQIRKVEEIVNTAINSALPLNFLETNYEEAIQHGALGFFQNRYEKKVKVFTIGDPQKPFSKEICGGPHVKNTGELGHFKIIKEESTSAGIRRIKGILE